MAGEAISMAFPQSQCHDTNPPPAKKKRNLPGTPDPEAEVIALSPKSLLETNRFLCEKCGKGFQRDQNLQLHRRGHNLPWKLRQRSTKEPRKRVYVCPEKSCVHHDPSRALGDLTGVKKHFCRKHGEKKWKCDKCSKRYAVQSDWKAHSKTCGTREYRCGCGTLFSRRDSFITHRAFCDALAEEAARISAASNISSLTSTGNNSYLLTGVPLMKPNTTPPQHYLSSSIFKPIDGEVIDQGSASGLSLWMGQGEDITTTTTTTTNNNNNNNQSFSDLHLFSDPFVSCTNPQQLDYQLSLIYGNNTKEADQTTAQPRQVSVPSLYSTQHQQTQSRPPPDMSATALLQKAAEIGVTSTDVSFLGSFNMLQCGSRSNKYDSSELFINPNLMTTTLVSSNCFQPVTTSSDFSTSRHRLGQKDDKEEGGQTRDFLGVGIQTLCPPSIQGWI